MACVVARTLMTLGASAALAAGSAHASDVHWSVGIQAPVGPGVSVGTVISNGHGFPVFAQVVVAPPPAYVPAPVVYSPPVVLAPPVVYAPAPIYAPSRVVYGAPVWAGGRWVRYPVHHHPYPAVWRPGFDHRGPSAPVRMPGREVRY